MIGREARGAPVFYTQDWHPASTPHFARDGGIWPVHCVAGHVGRASCTPTCASRVPSSARASNGEDGYSGFTMRDPAERADRAHGAGAACSEPRAWSVSWWRGLATDYCVQATVLDARALGFAVTVLTSAIRAVDLVEGDGERALARMREAGAHPGARRARRRAPRPRARAARLARMTTQDDRPYSPGLQGVVAGETELSLVDGANGRLLYRGYPIGELVDKGTYPKVAELLWTGDWPADAHLACAPLDARVLAGLVDLPNDAHPMDALRTAVSAWGAGHRIDWPPTVEQARKIVALAPSALAAFGRLRQGLEPIRPKPELDLAAGFLYQLNGVIPDEASARALDAYLVVAAEHGFNASTFTARVITSTRSDMASAVSGAVGALKGPLHGGAPSEVVSQLHEIGSPERAEESIAGAFERGERLMGFGHRIYRAYDPRAAALRDVARADGLRRRMAEAGRRRRGRRPAHAQGALPGPTRHDQRRVLHAAVLQGIGLPSDLFPATFAVARTVGWTAHILEQAAVDKLIRPDVRYTGPDERSLPRLSTSARGTAWHDRPHLRPHQHLERGGDHPLRGRVAAHLV